MESTDLVVKNGVENLDKKSEELVTKIVGEEDSDKLKDLVGLFNVNQSKKNIVRADIYSRLLDRISLQMVERLDKKSGEFSNKDLLDYLVAVRTAIDKSDISPENINMPIIQNNTQVNVNIDGGFNRESKEKIIDSVRAILERAKNNNQVIDINDEVEEINDKD
ncbi:MAG: hypothetical protein J6T10_28830 [Methanobrevibacter sp.]|nr:hypothetical protein [Methanobrevibacter sp.]